MKPSRSTITNLQHRDGANLETYKRMMQALDRGVGECAEGAGRGPGSTRNTIVDLHQRQRWRAFLGYMAVHRPERRIAGGWHPRAVLPALASA